MWTPSPEEQAQLDREKDRVDYEEAQARRDDQSNRDDANLGDYNRSTS